jgi:hypothetical protein
MSSTTNPAPVLLKCRWKKQFDSKTKRSVTAVPFVPQGEDWKTIKPELTESQKLQVKEAFDLFDTDGSGHIDSKVSSLVSSLVVVLSSSFIFHSILTLFFFFFLLLFLFSLLSSLSSLSPGIESSSSCFRFRTEKR